MKSRCTASRRACTRQPPCSLGSRPMRGPRCNRPVSCSSHTAEHRCERRYATRSHSQERNRKQYASCRGSCLSGCAGSSGLPRRRAARHTGIGAGPPGTRRSPIASAKRRG
eukprot:4242052-Prymnesium_polylepis.1